MINIILTNKNMSFNFVPLKYPCKCIMTLVFAVLYRHVTKLLDIIAK